MVLTRILLRPLVFTHGVALFSQLVATVLFRIECVPSALGLVPRSRTCMCLSVTSVQSKYLNMKALSVASRQSTGNGVDEDAFGAGTWLK